MSIHIYFRRKPTSFGSNVHLGRPWISLHVEGSNIASGERLGAWDRSGALKSRPYISLPNSSEVIRAVVAQLDGEDGENQRSLLQIRTVVNCTISQPGQSTHLSCPGNVEMFHNWDKRAPTKWHPDDSQWMHHCNEKIQSETHGEATQHFANKRRLIYLFLPNKNHPQRNGAIKWDG